MNITTEIETVFAQETISNREKEIFFPTYQRLDIGNVVSAKGAYVYTEDAKKYLDAIAGLGVNALGHSDPEIVSSIQIQAEKYLHLSNLYIQEPQILLAEKLSKLSGWSKVFFTNSGTEATEGALKLVRRYFLSDTKNSFVSISNGFHGRTYGALSIMDKEKYRHGFGPFLSGNSSATYSDISSLEQAVSDDTAAVILEVIQGEGGIIEIPPSFVEVLHSLRSKYGFLIIADEIQSGIGRTGTFFAYEQYGLQPDIVICAKALGGGLPLGAILTNDEIATSFTPGSHGTTFGGNPLACAAGLVVLQRLQDGLLNEVSSQSALLWNGLATLQLTYPDKIKEIRGKGYMIGIELFSGAKEVADYLLNQENVVVNVTAENTIRLLPPFIFNENEIQQLLMAINVSLSEVILQSINQPIMTKYNQI